jgi:hypothetical protein
MVLNAKRTPNVPVSIDSASEFVRECDIAREDGLADRPKAVPVHVAESRTFPDAVLWKQKGDAAVEELGLHQAG